MAEFTETTTTTYAVNCPDCHGDKVKKHGFQKGEQRYFCKTCKKAFRAGGKAQGRKMDAEMMGSAIRHYYTGKSYKQIAEGLKEEYDLEKEPSKATVYEWVRDYTTKAMKEMEGHKAKTGGHWVADEMAVTVNGYKDKLWLWNVMDSETRYILASHLTPSRDANAARAVLRKAIAAADKPPKTITSDKLKSYIKPIRELMPESKHMQSQGMGADINNNMSERLQGTFRDRIKTLRGMDSRKTGQHYLDGWVITYNHFKGHRSLHNKTPAYRAKVDAPFKEWSDVVKAEAAPRRKTVRVRPESQPKLKLPRLQGVQQKGKPKVDAPRVDVPPKAKRQRGFKAPKPVYPKTGTKRSQKRESVPPWMRRLPKPILSRISRN